MNYKSTSHSYKHTIICVLFICTWLPNYAQTTDTKQYNVTLQATSISLKEIFRSIQKQTGLRVMAPVDAVDMNERVSNVHFVNGSIQTVLSYILKDRDVQFLLKDNIILLRKGKPISQATEVQTSAKSIDITGSVTDTLGNPLIGATVKQLETGAGTVTNQSGAFILHTNARANISISFTGYVPQVIQVPANDAIGRVSLREDIKNIKGIEVYSTGYQQIPKERATGSFDLISNKLFNQQVSTNVLDRLEPIANGLQVNKKINGSAGQIIIRGLSTINGPKSPLIILNNFPYEGSLDNINPNDVATITILKDAAAASIWGTRAGNGVIVITTKQPSYSNQMRVDVTSNITVVQKPDLFKLKTIAPNDFVDAESFLFSQGFYDSREQDTYTRGPLSPVVEILIKQRDGLITADQAQSEIAKYRTHDVRSDYEKYFYSPAVNQQYAVSMQAGTDKLAWLLSTGYDRNLNELKAKEGRVTIRSENSFRPSEKLELKAGITYTSNNTSSGRPQFADLSTTFGNIPVYSYLADRNGKALPLLKDYRQPFIDTFYTGKLLDWNYYPTTDYKNIDATINNKDFLLSGSAKYTPLKWLSFTLNYQWERQTTESNTTYGKNSYYARNLINLYTQINPETNEITRPIPLGGIRNNNIGVLDAKSFRSQVVVNKGTKIGDFNGLVGMEVRQSATSGSSFTAYGYDHNNLLSSSVDYVNLYPNIINGNASRIPDGTGFSATENRFVSYFANLAYTYKDRYIFSSSARTDASNLFGVKSNDRWTPLWSAGLSWQISKEKFYKSELIPYLKARITYGFSGNVDQSLSALTVIQAAYTNPYTNTPATITTKFYNPSLKWEKVGMTNLALDFSLRNNIISGSIDFYHKKGVNLYGPTPIDYTVGVGQPVLTKNVASISGNGFDFQLNSTNIDKQIRWTTTLNLSNHSDKVISYYQQDQTANKYANGGLSISAIEGKPIYSIFSYKWRGLDPSTGDPQGILDGQKSKDYVALTGATSSVRDLLYNGPGMPSIYGSFSNTISYRGISLAINFLYKFGYYFHRESISYNNFINSYVGHADYSKRWKKPGDEKYTYVPSFAYPNVDGRDDFYNGSEILVEKGDNIRLQYINLSYAFPNTILKRLGLTKLSIFAYASNLGIIWRANKEKIDPDYSESQPPIQKSFSFGLQTSF